MGVLLYWSIFSSAALWFGSINELKKRREIEKLNEAKGNPDSLDSPLLDKEGSTDKVASKDL